MGRPRAVEVLSPLSYDPILCSLELKNVGRRKYLQAHNICLEMASCSTLMNRKLPLGFVTGISMCTKPEQSTTNSQAKRRRKPPGYWANIENIRTEIVNFNAAMGNMNKNQMPTSRELRLSGRRDLDNAISKNGGYSELGAKLGFLSSRKASGYWAIFENLEKELLDFIAQPALALPKNAMPTLKELREHRRSDIVEGIKQHGGVRKVAQRLGLKSRSQKRESGYWKDWARVEREVLKFMQGRSRRRGKLLSKEPRHEAPVPRENLMMPSQGELREAGRADLAEAITDYHGGFREVAKKLGVLSKKKDDYFYSKFYNLARELYTFVAKHGNDGVMPSSQELKEKRRSDIISAIRHFGGMSAVSQRLGLQYKVKTRESFRDWHVFRRRLLAFIELHGTSGELPSSRKLENFGRQDIYQAILHHGGPKEVADRMGLRRGYMQDFYYVGEQILDFINTHGTEGLMPTERDFLELGRGALNVAVAKFGYSQVAQRLGLKAPSQSSQVALNAFLNNAMSERDVDDCPWDWD